MVNAERVMTRQLILKWHDRARIDYSDLYVKQYIAYNAWFRKVTNTAVDYEAIRQLLQRFVIWDDYIHGRTLTNLGNIVDQIATLTAYLPARPVGQVWNGIVKDRNDWKGLIYFWYQTRCNLFHGLTIPGYGHDDTQIRLAYESLSIFMNEIVKRMRHCFVDADYVKLAEVRQLLEHEAGTGNGLREIETKLHKKFIHSPDLWNVDMERA